jgi:lipopolysaccharide transport system permease protein
MKSIQEENWDLIIDGKKSWFDLNLREVWRYRDLLLLFVKRDFVTFYKQTILGPLWFFIQPLLTTITFTFIFGTIAKLNTDGIPGPIFYLSGIIIWNYFSTCLTAVSGVFNANARIFGKVYFPRLIMPLSIVVSNLIKFLVQYIIFIVVLVYFIFQNKVHPNSWAFATPYLILLMAFMSLGIGMIISSLTTKYKDLSFLITFGLNLLMYLTPVIIPSSRVPESYKFLYELNPLVGIFECFKYGYLGSGHFTPSNLIYSSVVTVVFLFIGAMIFTRVEKSFMDTV